MNSNLAHIVKSCNPYSVEVAATIDPHNFTEWTNSVVDPKIIDLNVISPSGYSPSEYLLYNLSDSERRNDGRIRDKWLKRYAHLEHGGWWCSGVDILTGEDALWGCFKPDRPRQKVVYDNLGQFKKVKVIKYEHPPKTNTEIFALKVPPHIWDRIASRYGIKRYHSSLALRLKDRHRPVSFWEWVQKTPSLPLLVTEGAKKAGCLLTAGYGAIAFPGIYGGYRQPKDEYGNKIGKPYLIPQLEALATSGREVVFVFDRDTKLQTIANVRQAILTTGKLLQQKGCKVSVITWNYPEKGVDDLIAARGVECFEALYNARISLEEFQLEQLLDLSPYVSLRVNQRYLTQVEATERQGDEVTRRRGDEVTRRRGDFLPVSQSPSLPVSQSPSLPVSQSPSLKFLAEAILNAIKSAKGTGKTELLTQIVERAIANGQRVLVLSHREQLAKALANRFYIDYRTELRTSQTKGVFGYSLCIDSLHPTANPPFNPESWAGALVIIDEVEQVLWHALNSKTCIDYRVAIIKSLKELLQTVVSTGGKIYLADADLSPISLRYIQQLIGYPVPTWVVENTYNPNCGKRQLRPYDGHNPSSLVASLVTAINNGEKPFITTDAQKLSSKWGTQTLEAYLKKRFPDRKILRIDSQSVSDPSHPAYGCTGNLNAILPLYDIVIASPTIETGVSIDIKEHFTSVWAIANGVQTVDAVCQSLERVRDDVPRHLWAAKRGLNLIGHGATSIRALLASQHKLTQANIRLLNLADAPEFDSLDTDFSPESLKTWAKRACVVNLGLKNYREFIFKKLLKEGYEFVDEFPTDSLNNENSLEIAPEKVKTEVKAIQKENYQFDCQEVANIATPSEAEQKELERKQAKTKTERQRERKGKLVKRYGTEEITPEIADKDQRGWYGKLRQHYYLTVGAEFLTAKDKLSLLKMIEAGDGLVFKPDVNKRLLGAKTIALEKIEIKQFLDSEREFTSESLTDWQKNLIKLRHDLKTLTNITISPDNQETPIQLAQRLLTQLLGLKLEYMGKRGAKGQQERVYRGCNSNPDGRQEIFERWYERDCKLFERETQTVTSSVSSDNVTNDTVSTLSINTYKYTEEVDTERVTTESDSEEITPPQTPPSSNQLQPPENWTPQTGEEVLVYTPNFDSEWGLRGIVQTIARHASDCWEVLIDGVVRKIWRKDWLFPITPSGGFNST